MPAIDQLFASLRAANRKALMPFVTAGDPDLDFTSAALVELVGRGAHLCEVGIPYSDPIADGPVIQASYTRALERGVHLSDILGMLAQTTPRLSAPAVTMVSYAIVYRRGP
ncbi:MAG TPA: tryptophan synthase subunit alpha, partial [Lacipirellulaceae bacterium]|nr:tryptophan synthase subunit alpha [Lacipirellulaceae bacterium]